MRPAAGQEFFGKNSCAHEDAPRRTPDCPTGDAEWAGRWHHGRSEQGFGLLEAIDAWNRSSRTGRDREVAPDGAADCRGRGLRSLRGRGRPGGGAAGVAPQGMGNPGGLPQPPQAAGRPERGRSGDHPGASPARGPDDRRAERRASRAGRKANGQHPGRMRPDDRGRAGLGEDPADRADGPVPPGDAQGAGDPGLQPAGSSGYGALTLQQELGATAGAATSTARAGWAAACGWATACTRWTG